MPKKDAALIRVPFNCLIAPVTKEAITGLQNETKESQGEIVDRAIALLAFGEEVAAIAKPAKSPKPPVVTQSQAPPPLKRPGLPEWKRGPRPKGDKTR